MSPKVYVKKAVYDTNPVSGDPFSMLRIQDFGIRTNQGIPASRVAVPPDTIDFEDSVINPSYRFPLGEIIRDGSHPEDAEEMRPYQYQDKISQGYNKPGYIKPKLHSDMRGQTYVKPNRGLFFTPANLQDLGSAEVTGTSEYAPSRLLATSQNPLQQEGLNIRPAGSSPENLNEIFSSRDIAPKDVTDLTPIMTAERGYNPSWYDSKDPESAMGEERKFLERGNAATTQQMQAVARMLGRNPEIFNRTKPTMITDKKQYEDLHMDPKIFETDQTSDGEWGLGNAGQIADFLSEKVNLRPMDRGWKQVLGNRGLPESRINQMFSRRKPLSHSALNEGKKSAFDLIDDTNVPKQNKLNFSDGNMEVPPEFIDKNPERGFLRQGIDIDHIMDRLNNLERKADTSISKTDFASNMSYESCSCCTPMQQASVALLDSVFEKAENCPYCGGNPMVASTPDKTGYHGSCINCGKEITKAEKPFHGYNPNKHSRKGGLNAKGRATAKREQGSNLKPPVTTKPSKLKPGSKKANRRKSFCARMSGVKGPTSKGGKMTPKGAALKRWNC